MKHGLQIFSLLCLALLPACADRDSNDSETGDETSMDATDATDSTDSTDSGDGDGDSGDGDGDSGDGDGDSGDGDGDSGDGDGDSGDGDGDSGDGDGDASEACALGCTVTAMCDPEEEFDTCVTECEAAYNGASAECITALDAAAACIGALDCDGYTEYINGIEPPYPCSDEEAAAFAACV